MWEIDLEQRCFVRVSNRHWGHKYEAYDQSIYDGKATEPYISELAFDPNDQTRLKDELRKFDEGRESKIRAWIEQPRSEAYSELFVAQDFVPTIEHCIDVEGIEPIVGVYSNRRIRVFKNYIKHLITRDWIEQKRYNER